MFLIPVWLILSVLTGLASNAFNFLTRYFLRDKQNSVAFLWYVEFAKLVIALSVAVFFDWKLVLSPESIGLLLLTGFTQLIGGYYWVKMHEHSHLSISTILSRTRMIWVPIFAFIILGEQLTVIDYAGILILFVGVSIISAPHKLFVDKGATYANISAIIVAINIIFAKMVLPYASNSIIIAFHALPSVLLLPLIIKNARKTIAETISTRFKLKALAVSLNVLAFLFFTMAIRTGEVSKVNAIYQGMLFLSVLAGIIFLKEREDVPKKLIGTIVTVVGVILLSLY